MTRDNEAGGYEVHKKRESEIELGVLGVGGGENVVSQETEREEVKKPIRGGREVYIMGPILQGRSEVVIRMFTVTHRARIISIMAKISIKRRANVEIRKRILTLVFSVEFEIWKVSQWNIPIVLVPFIVPNMLNGARPSCSGCSTRALWNLRKT